MTYRKEEHLKPRKLSRLANVLSSIHLTT